MSYEIVQMAYRLMTERVLISVASASRLATPRWEVPLARDSARRPWAAQSRRQERAPGTALSLGATTRRRQRMGWSESECSCDPRLDLRNVREQLWYRAEPFAADAGTGEAMMQRLLDDLISVDHSKHCKQMRCADCHILNPLVYVFRDTNLDGTRAILLDEVDATLTDIAKP